MAGIADFLANLTGQPSPQAQNLLANAMQSYGSGALSNPAIQTQLAQARNMPAAAAQPATQANYAPQAPQPQPMQRSVPQGNSGGGIGEFLGNLIAPNATARNKTVGWLQKQGLDEGTATLLAGNKPALQKFLLERTRGADPMEALKLEKAQLEVDKLRNPTTDDIREYQFAKKGGYTGSFTDFMQSNRKAGATTVNVGNGAPGLGKLSSDYGYVLDPETGKPVIDPQTGLPRAAAIPGSPAAIKAQQAAEARKTGKQSQDRNANIVIQDIDRTLDMVKESPNLTTGVGGLVLSNVPGTDAFDASKLIDTVKANAGFDRLQAMRDASPTGGALGQVSEREMQFLQAAIGNLEQSQGTQQFVDNLKRVKNVYSDIIYGPGNGPERETLSFQKGQGASNFQPGTRAAKEPAEWRQKQLELARQAIEQKGKDPAAVRKLLEDNGFIVDGIEWLR